MLLNNWVTHFEFLVLVEALKNLQNLLLKKLSSLADCLLQRGTKLSGPHRDTIILIKPDKLNKHRCVRAQFEAGIITCHTKNCRKREFSLTSQCDPEHSLLNRFPCMGGVLSIKGFTLFPMLYTGTPSSFWEFY